MMCVFTGNERVGDGDVEQIAKANVSLFIYELLKFVTLLLLIPSILYFLINILDILWSKSYIAFRVYKMGLNSTVIDSPKIQTILYQMTGLLCFIPHI